MANGPGNRGRSARAILLAAAVLVVGVFLAGLRWTARDGRAAPHAPGPDETSGAVRPSVAAALHERRPEPAARDERLPVRILEGEPAQDELPEVQEPQGDERTEMAFHAWFVHLASQGELELLAADVLARKGPDCEKVAVLRALHDTGSPRTAELFLRALQELPADPPSRRVSVPSFALRYLGERAERDPLAREILREALWGGTRPMDDELRRRAAGALAAAVQGEERAELVAYLEKERDPLVVESARVALRATAWEDS